MRSSDRKALDEPPRMNIARKDIFVLWLITQGRGSSQKLGRQNDSSCGY